MPWHYEQATGRLFLDDDYVARGYSGHGGGKNNPEAESASNHGPIPRGEYLIGGLYEHPSKGPYCMHLMPADPAMTYGRSGFLIHGDSVLHPGEASHGCIVLPRAARIKVGMSGVGVLFVRRG